MSRPGFSALAGMVLVGDPAPDFPDFEADAPPPSKKARTTIAMRCEHNLLATELKVSKDGPNKGRSFFKCPKHEKSDQCSYFAWADEAAASAASAASASGSATGAGSATGSATGAGSAASGGMKCKCKLGAIVLEVKKEGKNKGKKFFKCGKREEAERCDFFEWVDQATPTAATAAFGGGGGGSSQHQPPPPRVSYSSATKPSATAIPRMDARKTRLLQSLRLVVTPEEALVIRNLPQRSDEWKTARKYRLTASNFGTAAGHNKYTTPDAYLKELVWPELNPFLGNEATRWGTFMEELACSEYTVFRQREWRDAFTTALRRGDLLPFGITEMPFKVEHTGLIVNPAAPWLGVSPDGLVHTKDPDTGEDVMGLLEIKAPWTQTIYAEQDKYADVLFPGIPAGIPPQYYDQIQGVMALAGLPWADFCVWTPSQIHVRRYTFDEAYWRDTLLPRLEAFYFERYIPAVQLKEAGKLKPGQISPSLDV